MGLCDDIKRKIENDVQNAMNVARDKTSKQLDDNILGFYGGGEPNIYSRTGTLIDASDVTSVSGGSDSYEFTASMDGNKISYSTGTFSGSQVVDATELGTSGVVGKSGYWEKTESEIPNIVDSELSKKFN